MGLYDTPNINPFSRELTVQENYEKLERYYDNNQLYDDLMYYAYQNNLWIENMKPLRNPVHRSVEFFAAKLLPGEVRVSAETDAVKEAIEQFHKWSNFQAQKSVASRQLALYGDLFWKVVTTETKIYAEIIDPKYVADFTADNRGYLTMIRMDIPQVDEDGKKYTYIEYWDKANNYWAIWHKYNSYGNMKLDQLGTPYDFGFISDWGIDFIPIVHVKFSDIGDVYGHSCVDHALDKIDEANRQITRLHEMLFRNNKSLWVVNSNKVDQKTGKFQPAPLLNEGNPELKDNQILYMPGLSDIKSLVPNINYADALAVVKDMMEEIASDLPEIRYFDVKDNTSGKAIRLLLGSAIDRAIEAQANLMAGLERIDEMALTLGTNMKFFGGLGSYQAGSFQHNIVVDEMFPLDYDEVAALVRDLSQAGVALATALRIAGFSDEFIEIALAEKQAQDAQNVLNDQTRFNAGAINLGV